MARLLVRCIVLVSSIIGCVLFFFRYIGAWADSVAIYIGYDMAVFGVPVLVGLALGACLSYVFHKAQGIALRKTWYFPFALVLASMGPYIYLMIMMMSGPT